MSIDRCDFGSLLSLCSRAIFRRDAAFGDPGPCMSYQLGQRVAVGALGGDVVSGSVEYLLVNSG